MFINFSNHSSKLWNKKQISAANKYGEIYDYPYPNISANDTIEQICQCALDSVDKIQAMKPNAVFCAGEFNLTFAMVSELKKRNILVLSAVAKRETKEIKLPDGTMQKTSRFDFNQFREYKTIDEALKNNQ